MSFYSLSFNTYVSLKYDLAALPQGIAISSGSKISPVIEYYVNGIYLLYFTV